MRDPATCHLCERRRSEVLGVWSPTPAVQKTLGGTPGKTLVCAYGLCLKCFRRPNSQRRVENKFIAEAHADLAVPGAN